LALLTPLPVKRSVASKSQSRIKGKHPSILGLAEVGMEPQDGAYDYTHWHGRKKYMAWESQAYGKF
jgi:hypothetical protein